MNFWEWYLSGFATMLAIEVALIWLVTSRIKRNPQIIIHHIMRAASGGKSKGKRANVPSRDTTRTSL